MKRSSKFRTAGWLAVAALLGVALAAPAGVLATDLKDTHQGISWDDPNFPGENCEDLDLGAGEVAWHFVLTQADATSGHLTATFEIAGEITVENWDSPAKILHFYVFTGPDTLLDAETTDVDGKNLVLSHICVGETTTTTTSTTSTETTSTETTDTTSSETTSSETTSSETTSSETTSSETTSSETTDTTSTVSSETTSSSTGSVLGETGRPRVTPPSTDAVSSNPANPSMDSWRLVLVAMGGLLAVTLLLTPAAAPRKR